MPTAQDRRRDRVNRWMWAGLDSAAWLVAVFLAVWLRFDLAFEHVTQPAVALFAASAIAGQVAFGGLFGPYAVGHDRGSFEETYDVGRTVLLTTLLLLTLVFAFHLGPIPRSVPFTAPAFAILAMFAGRFLLRSIQTRRAAVREEERRVLIFGAGEAGRRLTRSLVRDANSGFIPVAVLDDDRGKARLRFDGVKVRGDRSAMAAVAAKHSADTLIIALPLAEARTIRELTSLAEAVGLKVLTLPPIKDIIGGRPTAGDLRDVDVADLLGRRPVQLDTTLIAEQLAGRTILVTGAGGSIGSELCRQIARFGPAKLYLLDRDESGLQATQLSLVGHGLLTSDTIALVDIRDRRALDAVFRRTRPDMVFHAAALKHLPLLESHPLEAWKTNVLGTQNVLAAAAEVGVGTFVNISTDKAANPSCVLGYSKRVAERLTAEFAHNHPGTYVSVRFGNVLGSRGSVVHAFTAQIELGGPITVTHPDVERYFMLIPEACQLVLEAASIGADGEVMVLDMGEPVKILQVANMLLGLSGRRDIDIVYTGLRPGEKVSEELFSDSEQSGTTRHRLVSRVHVPELASAAITSLAFDSGAEATRWMRGQSLGTVPGQARTGTT